MPKPANLIFFLTDNHNREFLGAAGHPMVKTPAMDSIANRGVRFANAYCASPLCCPSRAALATGRYPHQTGYWDNAMIYDGAIPTWHHRIRDAGADMAAIGKLHYRSTEDDNGFSEEIATMHVVEGTGALVSLLRATQDGVPRRESHRALYQDSIVGEADYQIYDRQITGHAVDWLRAHRDQDKPWALLVSYPSPHPPFKVPQRFWDMYKPEDAPLPVQWRRDEQPHHPATEYLAWMNSLQDGFDEEFIRRVIAGYCGLITHTDEQIGLVLKEAEALGMLDDTRVVYTSDHGEAAGHHGILGKANHYEHAIGVPLLMAGPDIPQGKVIDQCASHVDLFPTLVEAMGADSSNADADLPGASLWPALEGRETARAAFAEYHAMGSRNSGFAIRDGDMKLIYHVGMDNQLFDLAADPREEHDLLANGATHPAAAGLERTLRDMLDPEDVDARSKAEQAAHMEKFGGPEAVRKTGVFSMSPIPGKAADVERV
ncbi:MAG: sulfatase-like hydrolase/transferase [Rhodospirillaceae bacterium]|jgi:choline-sulfatase|nr:sulfatase-like hydrolase/transferase [Rhodospirillaceae bacterium]MBT5811671.1 sulfatase-like hydrolase/transferase [Rhodospirillaceae bacterium]